MGFLWCGVSIGLSRTVFQVLLIYLYFLFWLVIELDIFFIKFFKNMIYLKQYAYIYIYEKK